MKNDRFKRERAIRQSTQNPIQKNINSGKVVVEGGGRGDKVVKNNSIVLEHLCSILAQFCTSHEHRVVRVPHPPPQSLVFKSSAGPASRFTETH